MNIDNYIASIKDQIDELPQIKFINELEELPERMKKGVDDKQLLEYYKRNMFSALVKPAAKSFFDVMGVGFMMDAHCDKLFMRHLRKNLNSNIRL